MDKLALILSTLFFWFAISAALATNGPPTNGPVPGTEPGEISVSR